MAGPPAAVPMGSVVMVIQGVCDPVKPRVPNKPCELKMTREQFEKIWSTVTRQGGKTPVVEQPAAARKNIAQTYGKLAALSQEAAKEGLDKSPEFQLQSKLLRMQLLATQMQQRIRQRNAEASAVEIEKYYKDNLGGYQELSMHRLQIPKRGMQPPAAEGKATPESPTMSETEAEAYRKRAMAGEDFDKLQKEVFDKLQFKTAEPVTSGKRRHGEFPPQEEAEIFSTPQGGMTRLFDEGTSFVFYKIDGKRTLSLDEVRGNIAQNLAQQKARDEEDKITRAAKPQFPTDYFTDLPKKDESTSDLPMKEPAPKP